MTDRQAVILAGGKGTRLAPFNTVLPKPLMPLGEVSILEIVLRQLDREGFSEAVLATGHLSEIIEAFCVSLQQN
jgi:NDP-sugar pyrophosphorylase family protein